MYGAARLCVHFRETLSARKELKMKLAVILALLRRQWRNVAVKSGAALYRLLWCGAALSLSLLAGFGSASLWPATVAAALTLIPLAAFLSWLTWPYVQSGILRSRNKLMVIHYLRDERIEESRVSRAVASASTNGRIDNEELQLQTRALRAAILSEAYPSCPGLLEPAPEQINIPYNGSLHGSSDGETTITFTYANGFCLDTQGRLR
jgi:hypothetical protein